MPDQVVLVSVVLAVITGFFLISVFAFKTYPYVPQERLLTQAELRFYKVLLQILPKNVLVMMKVRMADIITCSEKDWSAGWGPKISAKHIDFTLIDSQTSDIICCLELDDRSHLEKERVKRDKFVNKAFKTADVPLLRIPVARHYDPEEIASLIEVHL